MNDIPRRNRIDKHSPGETAISAAIRAVEEMGAHPLLTDAVVLLGQAQAKVADFVDGQPHRHETGTELSMCPECRRAADATACGGNN